MGKANNRIRKPDTELVDLTYDELETALVALSIRQEELREMRTPRDNQELELIWYVSDKMDGAQRRLESRMTDQMSNWLRSIERETKSGGESASRKRHPAKKAKRKRRGLLERLSRISRL
ncbi:MAG: hypothetical protein FJ275_14290 [Planctomycetes bacterium]|nr:hypothetical protein [Planctomycetota bacterium]